MKRITLLSIALLLVLACVGCSTTENGASGSPQMSTEDAKQSASSEVASDAVVEPEPETKTWKKGSFSVDYPAEWEVYDEGDKLNAGITVKSQRGLQALVMGAVLDSTGLSPQSDENSRLESWLYLYQATFISRLTDDLKSSNIKELGFTNDKEIATLTNTFTLSNENGGHFNCTARSFLNNSGEYAIVIAGSFVGGAKWFADDASAIIESARMEKADAPVESEPQSQPTQAAPTSYSDGLYRVGQDMPAGEYKLTATSTSGYWEVRGSSDPDADIIGNDFFKGATYVTVTDGQYLKLSRCTAEPV